MTTSGTTSFSTRQTKTRPVSWLWALDKKPEDRTAEDIEIIVTQLRQMDVFRACQPYLLRQLSASLCHATLKRGIVLCRHGDKPPVWWYMVMSGSLLVTQSHHQSRWQRHEPIRLARVLGSGSVLASEECNWLTTAVGAEPTTNALTATLAAPPPPMLAAAAVDGEVVEDCATPLQCSTATVTTAEYCELLYMDQTDFRLMWQENQKFFQDLNISRGAGDSAKSPQSVVPPTASPSQLSHHIQNSKIKYLGEPAPTGIKRNAEGRTADGPSPGHSPTAQPRETSLTRGFAISHPMRFYYSVKIAPEMLRAACLIRAAILRSAVMHKDSSWMPGADMITWMCQQIRMDDRQLGLGIWQALIEGGVLSSAEPNDFEMRDSSHLYTFFNIPSTTAPPPPSGDHPPLNGNGGGVEQDAKSDSLQSAVNMLVKTAPDALFRLILQKPTRQRQPKETEFVFGELLHISALSHLSTTVKRQLASVLIFEAHPEAGRTLFKQGDEGISWYIILKGSVDVHIQGKGVVCTLQDGDDFGKLALVNNAPRAATIVLKEDNCHFLRVDKDDFNRILRDVEANTVHLKEHGKDVLVLEKITGPRETNLPARYLYSVMAGTPEKTLEHLLETHLDMSDFEADNTSGGTKERSADRFVEDFILTHPIFITNASLCSLLHDYAQCSLHMHAGDEPGIECQELMLNKKRRVLQLLYWWAFISGRAFLEDPTIPAFAQDVKHSLLSSSQKCPSFRVDTTLEALEPLLLRVPSKESSAPSSSESTPKRLSRRSRLSKSSSSSMSKSSHCIERPPLRASDIAVFNVYTREHACGTHRLPTGASVKEILRATRELRMNLHIDRERSADDLVLCEVRSDGERVVLKPDDLGVTTGLSVNGRLFVCLADQLPHLVPLPEQTEVPESTANLLDTVGIEELAVQMTQLDWELLTNVHVYELIYQVFGRARFGQITGNLDLFSRQFSLVQHWVVTELCLVPPLGKRVHLLKKFIKLAARLLDLKNMNSFFAIMCGLHNSAISRLNLTWDKLPNKYNKLFADLSTMLDPSRNHRVFRQTMAKLEPPVIPFLALLMKDMTFTHEGNRTWLEGGMVNFEKMQLIARNLRGLLHCRSKPLQVAGGEKAQPDLRTYVHQLRCIDDQKVLTNLSLRLEPRKS